MKVNREKIMLLLALKGMRQQDLADNSCMSRGNLSTIINGKTCRPDTVLRIANALGCKITEIIEEERD